MSFSSYVMILHVFHLLSAATDVVIKPPGSLHIEKQEVFLQIRCIENVVCCVELGCYSTD